jgi:hypothetical protein
MNMTRAYIRFATHEDEIKGIPLLVMRTRVDSYVGGVVAVPAELLSLLDENHIAYSEVPHEEVVRTFERVRQIHQQLMNGDRRPKKSKKSKSPKSG